MIVWYRVRDLDAARVLYKETLGFTEVYVDWDDRWARLERNGCELAIARGRAGGGGRRRARSTSTTSRPRRSGCATLGADVGVVLELHEEMRLVDVFDPDGNRIQLTQEVV